MSESIPLLLAINISAYLLLHSVFFLLFYHMPNRFVIFFSRSPNSSIFIVFPLKNCDLSHNDGKKTKHYTKYFFIFLFWNIHKIQKTIQKRIIFFFPLKEIWKFAITFELHLESCYKKIELLSLISERFFVPERSLRKKMFISAEERKKTDEISTKPIISQKKKRKIVI